MLQVTVDAISAMNVAVKNIPAWYLLSVGFVMCPENFMVERA